MEAIVFQFMPVTSADIFPGVEIWTQDTDDMRIAILELISYFHLNIGLSSGIWGK